MEIKNRIEFGMYESDLVYPLDKGWFCICKVDDKWMKDTLKIMSGGKVTEIHNKYAIEIGNRGVFYRHDEHYYLITKI